MFGPQASIHSLRLVMRSDFFRLRFKSPLVIAFVFPGGLVLSGLPAGEDPSHAGYSVAIKARRKNSAGLNYVAQVAHGLFSFRFDKPIVLDALDTKARLTLFKDGARVSSRTIAAAAVFGAIDNVGNGEVRGWVCPAFQGAPPISPELVINGTHRIPIVCTRYRLDLSPLTAGDPLIGFQLPLPASLPAGEVRTAEIYVADTLIARSAHPAVQTAEAASGQDRRGPPRSIADIADIRRLKAEIRAARLQNDIRHLQYLRQRLARLREPKGADLVQVSGSPAKPRETAPISVVVPVYRDLASLRRCIEHLIASRRVTPFDIVVVNDCSPDADVRRYLQALSTERAITLVENERNLGFVGSVNVGLKWVAADHDVVLLNSDAFVPLRWLEKLSAIAYSEPFVASVTPMSNAATIFSFPRPNQDNPMLPGLDVDSIDERFARAAELLGYSSVAVPTGVGFCMYLTRQALDEVGGFAEEFAPGYGEENDWCKRAEDRGLRNLGAANTFVEHVGSVSFSEKRADLIRDHMDILNAKYPEYMPEVMDFIAEDPFGAFRVTADLVGQTGTRTAVVHFLHGWGGGIAEHIADIRRYTSDLALHILASSDRHDNNFVNVNVGQAEWSHKISKPSFMHLLRIFPKAFGFDPHMHFHSTIGMSSDVQELSELPCSSKTATIHDYSLRCPRIFLLTSGNRFCGLPDVGTCERCIRIAGPLEGLEEEYSRFESVHDWVAAGERFLSSMNNVTSPSRDLSSRFPFPAGVHSSVVPHLEAPIRPFAIVRPRRPLRIGMLGAIGPHKGSREIRALAENIELRDLPIKLFLVGYTDDDKVFENRRSIIITGPYEKRSAPALLQSLDLDFVLIPSIWPETYSFTVSEAWRSGLPVMTIFEGGHSDRVMEAQGFGYSPLRSLQPDDLVAAIFAFAAELEKRVGHMVRPAVVSPADWFKMTYEFDRDEPGSRPLQGAA